MSERSPAPDGAFSSEERKKPIGPATELDDGTAAVASVAQKRPPAAWRRYGVTVIVSAFVAAVVATVVSVGVHVAATKPPPRDDRMRDDLMVQKGKVTVGANAEKEVYYAVPYEGPPNVEFETDGPVNWDGVKFKEQKADHFTVQYSAPFGGAVHLRWKAEGIPSRIPARDRKN